MPTTSPSSTIRRTAKKQYKPLKTRIAPILAAAIREKREETGKPVRFKKR